MRRARVSYLLVAGVLIGTYFLAPVTRPAASVGTGVVAIAAIALGVVEYRPPRRGAWAMVAVTAALTTATNVAFVIAASRGPLPPYPALYDVLSVLQYMPAAAALLWLGQPELPSRDPGMFLDTINLSLAGSLILWVTVVRTEIDVRALTTASLMLTIAAWVGFVALLAALMRILVDWYRNWSVRLVSVGVMLFLIADGIYLVGLLRNTRAVGGFTDLGYLLSNAIIGLAALLPSMALIASNKHVRHRVGPVRIIILAIVLLAGPTLLLMQASSGLITTAVTIGSVMLVIAIVTIVRVTTMALAHRERARRERASRTAARSLHHATTEAEVIQCIDAAIRTMLAGTARHRVELLGAEPAPALTRDDDLSTSRRAVGRLRLPVSAPGGTQSITRGRKPSPPRTLQFTAPIAQLVELYPTLQGLADQAGMALDRIALLAKLRAEEREHHFRTLVQTSRDVTLISRHGRIEYATPSATELFGREVQGGLLPRLLTTEPPPPGPSPARRSSGDEGVERYIRRPDGQVLTVLQRVRDLTDDPTVNGVVTTLRDVTAERDLQRDLAHRASHDPLTGLANADLFGAAIRADDARAALYIDLDDFKDINDTYGHEIGDAILRTTARRIESCLRSGDLAARIGGDEFAVLLRDVPDRNAAESIAQRLADVLAQPAAMDGQMLTCRASIGLAYAEADAPTLLRNADAALYDAKRHGKGRWSQYQPGMSIPTRKRVDVRRRITSAMDNGALRVHYQPIVELTTGAVVGFEALLLSLDDEDPMTPREVVKAAEDTGLITALGEWVLGTALRDYDGLDRGRGHYVSVNVSPEQVRDRDFIDVVRRQLDRSNVDARRVVLEVTEHARVQPPYDRSWEYLAEVRDLGVRIAIDDFGTGYANLAYLYQPVVDVVKLDGSFLINATSPRATAVLRHSAALFRDLDLELIAEGVAEPAARDVLIEVGFRYGQGYLYAPPLPVDEAAQWSPAPWLADE